MRIWVLGAPDPEMEAIEGLLRQAGEQVIYALGPDGRRVRPDEAYRAERLSGDVSPGEQLYRVECDGPAIPAGAVALDHHRPGDPGFGRPPSEFLPASSVGQVILALARLGRLPVGGVLGSICITDPTFAEARPGPGWVICGAAYRDEGSGHAVAPSLVLAAAADHCLAAAYRGECPGVDPDALMRWRAQSRARFQGRPVEAVLADVERARQALRAAPVIELAPGVTARDLRGQHVPELPEASAREGLCFVADPLPGPDGRVKIVCQSGRPEQIRAFMEIWAPANGLVGVYGDPARGFAGGYKPAE